MPLGGQINRIYSRRMLDVTRLRVLVAVARHGSVTRAAQELNYAQPSVSHHLSRLEAETGTKLIQRAGRGIRLTDAGRLLAERAAEVIGRLDAAESELAAYAGLRAGRLRLAAFPSALGTLVPAAAAALRTSHPDIDLRLTEAEPPEALRMLRAGYVDVALIFRHTDSTETQDQDVSDLREDLVLDEPVYLVTSASDTHLAPAITELPTADLAQFAERRWIAGCDRCRDHLLRQCAMAGFNPRIMFTTDDFVAVQALVTAGLGMSTLPEMALRAARNPGIRSVKIRGTRRQVFAVRYGEPPDPPASALLLAAFRAAALNLAGKVPLHGRADRRDQIFRARGGQRLKPQHVPGESQADDLTGDQRRPVFPLPGIEITVRRLLQHDEDGPGHELAEHRRRVLVRRSGPQQAEEDRTDVYRAPDGEHRPHQGLAEVIGELGTPFRSLRRQHRPDTLRRHRRQFHGHREQLLLGAIKVVDESRIHARVGGDGPDRCRVVALFTEPPPRGGDDRLAGPAVSGASSCAPPSRPR
jgi:DNA-binding transcriptional LysR family regulator